MKQETKHLLRRTLCYLLPYKREFLVVGLTLVLSTVIGFLQPLVIQRITDSGMMQRDMAVILSSALLLAVLVLGNQAIDLLQTRIFADVHNASYGRQKDHEYLMRDFQKAYRYRFYGPS